LDPKFAFEEIEDEQDTQKQISSLKKLLETKRNRSGYGDRTGQLYQETDLIDFLQCEDPYLFLSTYNKVCLFPISFISSLLTRKRELKPLLVSTLQKI
jgi:hypothetical protein